MTARLPLVFGADGLPQQIQAADLLVFGCGGFSPEGRLTLSSSTPVLSSTLSAAATIYYTPYVGNGVPSWNGTNFTTGIFAEVSQALSDATKSPTAAVASMGYDLFGWYDNGTFRVTRGPKWTDGATAGTWTAGGGTCARGTGAGSTALTRVQGLLVNQYAITNGPAAGYGVFLGTIATDASGATVSFNFGGSAAGGTAAVVGLWNAFNRVTVGGYVQDTTSSWTYASAAWRAADGSTGFRVTFVQGLAEDAWDAAYHALGNASTTGFALTGIGLDTTTTTGNAPQGFFAAGATGTSVVARRAVSGLIGQHFLAGLEYSSAGTATFVGVSNGASGLVWTGRY